MPALYNFPFAEVMNIQNKGGNNLWAVWALCGVSLSLRSAGCILPEASQRRQEHTNSYVFLSLHTWEQDNLRKLHLRQKSLWNEMHIFTLICSYAREVLWLRSKAFSDSWQHLSWEMSFSTGCLTMISFLFGGKTDLPQHMRSNRSNNTHCLSSYHHLTGSPVFQPASFPTP